MKTKINTFLEDKMHATSGDQENWWFIGIWNWLHKFVSWHGHMNPKSLRSTELSKEDVGFKYWSTDELKLFYSAVESILLYGCESWVMTKKVEKKEEHTYVESNEKRLMESTHDRTPSVRPIWFMEKTGRKSYIMSPN